LHFRLSPFAAQGLAVWKLIRILLHIMVGFATILLLFPRLSQEQKEIRIQLWSLKLLRCIAIDLVVNGEPAKQGPVLIVANHISWLDIASMHAARFCRFVSKSDVKAWPVIGTLASGVGTLFIERESRRDALRVVALMTERLRLGDVVAVFPEGTTGDGTQLLPFHANLLQAAIAADVAIQPVALDFVDSKTGKVSLAPCYVGDDTLWRSVWRTLCAENIQVRVSFGALQTAQGRTRRQWAEDLRATIGGLRTFSWQAQ
jgi:1-acyl-sn-glycerol-3-phosphate acyltransferase